MLVNVWQQASDCPLAKAKAHLRGTCLDLAPRCHGRLANMHAPVPGAIVFHLLVCVGV